MGIMTDRQFEEFLRNAAQDYNRPPEGTPTEEIWADIDEARSGGWQRSQWRSAAPWWSLGRGIAATVALWVFPLTAVAGGAALAINHWTSDDTGSELAHLEIGHDQEQDTRHGHGQHAECGDIDTRVAALNALLQMETEQALPILMDVLERRDVCSVELRRRAVFLISQHETRETDDILLDAAIEDPDEEVRQQAVFWLGQLSSDEAVSALESILQDADDIELKKKVIFALSQHGSSRATRILRDIALDSRAHEEVREQAIFWLGEEGTSEDLSALMNLYDRMDNDHLREKIIFAVSQSGASNAEEWLLGVASDHRESMDLRENAVFWLGQRQSQAAVEALESVLFGGVQELQEKAVFALSQHGSNRAMELLRGVVVDGNAHPETREQAIFWLGQEGSSEDVATLMDMYRQIQSHDLKEKIIFAVSQNGDREGEEWLLDLARNEREPMELRKNALFWVGQEGDIDAADLRELYDEAAAFEFKEHVIFVLSQRDERDAVEELITIARGERDEELRDKAIFWLGQTDDQKAAEFLAELINRPTR
jgi:HEAT repeat protein